MSFPNQRYARPSEIYVLKRCFSEDYELVRVHHPDSAHSRASDLPKRIRDERFSAIKDAYDVLAGKRPGHPSRRNSSNAGRDRGSLVHRPRRSNGGNEPSHWWVVVGPILGAETVVARSPTVV